MFNFSFSSRFAGILFITLLLTESCTVTTGNDPTPQDGPKYAASTLARTWKAENVFNVVVDGKLNSMSFAQDFIQEITFKTDGSFTYSNSTQKNQAGQWKFVGKENLELTYGGQKQEFVIYTLRADKFDIGTTDFDLSKSASSRTATETYWIGEADKTLTQFGMGINQVNPKPKKMSVVLFFVKK